MTPGPEEADDLGGNGSVLGDKELIPQRMDARRVAEGAAVETELDPLHERRLAQALDDLLAAVCASRGTDDLLPKLAPILAEAARVDVVDVRLREGERLRSRVASGVEQDGAPGTAVGVDEALGDRDLAAGRVYSCLAGDPLWRGLERADLRSRFCLPLSGGAGERIGGVVLLGAREERQLSGADRRLLGLLGTRVADALAHCAATEELRRAVSSRDDILAIVAHDLRNPLNVIVLAANALLHRLPDSSARRTVDRIITGAHRADRLIRDLLEINAIERGAFSVDTGPVDPATLILSALESQQALVADASVIIGTDLSPELPLVEADEERLLEVLENLIGNAIKFTSSGGSITVGAMARAGEILVWVRDSGSGISAENLPHIFDRFWQGRSGERRGAGLGLTICKAIVEQHGGRIWAESAVGAGTTIFFTIPARGVDADEEDAGEVASILLIDDRAENLLSLKAILERPNYRLVTAQSGEEALRLALRERFSVALIDVAMPGMNGLEVAVHLKELERSRDIPIIFITAFGDDPEEVHRAYSAGGADYLVKPLDAEIVRKKVAVFVGLDRRRLARDPRGKGR
jgi:signal transduction histidine kinase/CheY-like chemotaxis protein